jgi:hypothetical protein
VLRQCVCQLKNVSEINGISGWGGLRLATFFTVHAVGACEWHALNEHMGISCPIKEKCMKTAIMINRPVFLAGATAALALAAMSFAGSAHARDDLSWSVGVGAPGMSLNLSNAGPMYMQPVYIQPEPVYYQPRPVYIRQAPVYMRSLPVYYARPYGWNRRHGGQYPYASRVYYQRDGHSDRRQDGRHEERR